MVSIKNENFVTIQGWMINNLKLKGNELLTYAIIYGFTQDGEQWFEGSRSYLAAWCNSTTKGIQNNLKSLVDKKFIFKKEMYINNVKFCKYQANLNFEECPKMGGGEQSSLPPREVSSLPREQSSPNNIEDIIYKNNIEKKKEKYIKEKRNDHFCQNDRLSQEAIKGTTVPVVEELKTKRSSLNNGIVISKSENKDVIKENESNSADNKKAPRVSEKLLKSEFEKLWALYPRKQGKKAAEAAYIRARRRGVEADVVASGIKSYVNYINAKKISQEYVKQGSTFFNQNSWDDEWEVENKPSVPKKNKEHKDKYLEMLDELREDALKHNDEKYLKEIDEMERQYLEGTKKKGE